MFVPILALFFFNCSYGLPLLGDSQQRLLRKKNKTSLQNTHRYAGKIKIAHVLTPKFDDYVDTQVFLTLNSHCSAIFDEIASVQPRTMTTAYPNLWLNDYICWTHRKCRSGGRMCYSSKLLVRHFNLKELVS